MSHYTLINSSSGEVLFTCVTDGTPIAYGAGEEVLNLGAPPYTYWDGANFVPFPPKPGATHVWDWPTKQWIDPRTLADRKEAQWAAIKAARNSLEFGGFTWDGSAFDSDQQAQARIQGGVQLATIAASQGQPFSIDWTLADNSIRTLSGADMIAVGMELAAHVQSIHATARVLRVQIEAASTIEEVDAIQWPQT